ncbi:MULTISPECIES: hypothetical protein [unclassified Mammaliicoccus]|nr:MULTISPECIES: hypothetical protein [unclassified Mammaliicoccus]
MKIIFKVIFKNLKSFLSKEENTKMLAGMFIKFFYKVAKQAKENKAEQSN